MPLKEKLTFKPFRPVAKLHGNCFALGTGKSLSEAVILMSTNPQYNVRLFIKIASSEHVYINCSEFQNKNKNNLSTHVLSLQFS